MDAVIQPSSLSGAIEAVASKSMAHRLLILSALSDNPCLLDCPTTSADIEATASCLVALGLPDSRLPHSGAYVAAEVPASLDCKESGSTLRFLLPVMGALSVPGRMARHGRLSTRPIGRFSRQLEAHGMRIEEDGEDLVVGGTLHGGRFVLPGNVSSQYASALLMVAPMLDEPMELWLETPVHSRPYIAITLDALSLFGVTPSHGRIQHANTSYETFVVEPCELDPPPSLRVEGDWSNAAFWLCAGALEREGLTVTGLNLASSQGDRTILAALASMGARIARKGDAARATSDRPRAAHIDVSAIPDLVPPLAAVCATTPGTSTFLNAGRLRLKESDRLQTICDAISALGGRARIEDDDLVVTGVERLQGGVVDAANDHRIAMMAAVMATHALDAVTVLGADCVTKSYPHFWDDYEQLGGIVHRRDA